MTQPRRDVRPTHDFWRDLDRHLPRERGPDGEPSRHDFQAYELVPILERFMTGWNDLPCPVPGRTDYRILITAGVLVSAITVVGQLAADGAVELVGLTVDTTWPDHAAEDDDAL